MDDQVSLVKYFADVSKLVTICYKLSLEKQDLLRKTQCYPENKSQNEQKIPSYEQFHKQSKFNDDKILESQKRKQDKQNKKSKLSKTRSSKNFFQRQIKTSSNKMQKENKTFNCLECDKKYYHLQSLKRHIKFNHQIIKLKNLREE
ncbi:unnamed protein product [Paramecium sonneborni]|uniref:C2H2-type domain-containing protein n=1 Tax=Paramecium sonneborni TaxID=65129 RepID=A0A8S1LGQ3_9CILI|nr:unnamed protein product [Paramecium sonneborni]